LLLITKEAAARRFSNSGKVNRKSDGFTSPLKS